MLRSEYVLMTSILDWSQDLKGEGPRPSKEEQLLNRVGEKELPKTVSNESLGVEVG